MKRSDKRQNNALEEISVKDMEIYYQKKSAGEE